MTSRCPWAGRAVTLCLFAAGACAEPEPRTAGGAAGAGTAGSTAPGGNGGAAGTAGTNGGTGLGGNGVGVGGAGTTGSAGEGEGGSTGGGAGATGGGGGGAAGVAGTGGRGGASGAAGVGARGGASGAVGAAGATGTGATTGTAGTTGAAGSTGGGNTGYVPKVGYNCPGIKKPTCDPAKPTAYTALTGSIGTHDPNVTADASCNFYEFATGQIGPQKRSTDLVAWSNYSATATSAAASGAQIWAADATFANGQFYVYFSIWHGAINTAEIGMVTNKTLVTGSPDYKWVDNGSIVNRSNGGNQGISGKTNVNIIDPNLFIDDDGSWWLIYGSFNDGVRLIPLDSTTGKPKDNPLKPVAITDHLGEGASLIRNGNFYYVMVSRGGCCSGTSSSYEVVYARSTSVTGPYTTKSGRSFSTSSYQDSTDALMRVGFEGNAGGQGGSHMLRVNGQWYIDYHAYDGKAGPATFVVRPIYFDSAGWPTFDCTQSAN